MDPILALPDFALAFLVAAHLCQTTGDRDFCRDAIERAHNDPRLAVYVDLSKQLRRQ